MKLISKGVCSVFLGSALVTSSALAAEVAKHVEPTLVNAFYNPKTGEVFVHTKEKGVLYKAGVLSSDRPKSNLAGVPISDANKSGRQQCVTTTQTICTSVVYTGSGPICTGTAVVTTTNCN